MLKYLYSFIFFLLALHPTTAQVKEPESCNKQTRALISTALEKEEGSNSIAAFNLLEAELQKDLDEKCRARILLELGKLGNRYNQLVKSVKYLTEANKIFNKYNMRQEQIEANNLIGGSYYILGDYDITVKYTKSAIELALRNNRDRQLSTLYNNLAGALGKISKYDSAIYYVGLCIKTSKKSNDQKSLLHALSTKAEIYLMQNNFKEAEKYFLDVLEIGANTDLLDASIEAACFYGLAKCNLYFGYLPKALDYGRKGLSRAVRDANLTIAEESARLLYQIWEEYNNSDSAFYYLRQNEIYQGKLKPKENLSQLNRLRMREAEEQIEAEKEKAKQQQQLTQIGIVIASFSLLLFITVFFFYRNSKKLNQKLKDKNETIHKANILLAEQKDELNHLGKVKDRIFSAVIHDFKTPLNTLESMLNLLIKQYLTPKEAADNAQKLLHKLSKSRLSINSTIAWIKTQLNGYKLQSQTINFNEFLDEISHYHQSDLIRKDITLHTETEESLQFESDKELLFIIINNLITNAIKFSYQGGSMKIKSFTRDERLIIQVKDNGIGMKQSQLEKIFSGNSLATNGTSLEKGSGLGLRISHELIGNLKGEISAKSEEGIGTEIQISIPIRTT